MIGTIDETSTQTVQQQWTCDRCGSVTLGPTPHSSGYCRDCRMVVLTPDGGDGRVRRVVNGTTIVCRSWQGDYDQFERPMLDGQLHKPGRRTCGHSDCVNETHIERDDVATGA
jgi:hypothetical protein